MALPLPGEGFVVKASDQAEPRWPGEHCDVLLLLVPLQDLSGRRRDLCVDAAMLLDAPHASLCLYHIWHLKARPILRHNVRDDARPEARSAFWGRGRSHS